MSGTFTLTGHLISADRTTPHAQATVVITLPPLPDSSDAAIYSGTMQIVTDADGKFTTPLVTNTLGIPYTVSSGESYFAPVTFLSPSAGATVDLSSVVPYNPSDSIIDGGTP